MTAQPRAAANGSAEPHAGPDGSAEPLSDRLAAALDDLLRTDDAALVELTMMIAVENQRSRFNSALGLTSQGFTDRCEIPAGR